MDEVKGYTSNEKFICSSFFFDKKIIFYLLVRILGLINTFKKQILLGRSNVTIYITFFTTIELANFSFYWFLFESPLTLFYHLTFGDLKIFVWLKFGPFFAWRPQAIASLAQYVELALIVLAIQKQIPNSSQQGLVWIQGREGSKGEKSKDD